MSQKSEIGCVLFALGPQWEAGKKRLGERLSEAGIRWENRMQTPDVPGASRAEDLLVLTDSRRLAAELLRWGIACVGCMAGPGGYFDGVGLVLESLDDVDVKTLETYLLHYHHRPVTVARTQRLLLREITERDFDALSDISRQMGMQYVQSPSGGDFFERERLSAYAARAYALYGYGLWSVEKHDGTLIGCCGLSDCEWESGKTVLELQYMLDEAFRGQGYGREMCTAALRYAFTELEAPEVWLRIHPENRASLALAQSLGFSLVGQSPLLLRLVLSRGAFWTKCTEIPGFEDSVKQKEVSV